MKIFLLVFALLFSVGSLKSQKSINLQKKVEAIYNDAKNKAQSGDYEKAADLLLRLLKTDPDYYQAHFALAAVYNNSGKPDLEIEELKKGLKLSGNSFPNGFKYLAQILYLKGNYADALKNIDQYALLKKSLDPDEARLLKSCSFATTAIQNPVPFYPENAGSAINSEDDEYWPCLNAEGNELIFTRLIKKDESGGNISIPQEDLYRSVKDSVTWRASVSLGLPVNTPENEGAQCISADGRLLFFTACRRTDGSGSCDIYMSVKKNGVWSSPVNLGAPVNSGSWETQPSVSADGKTLYFTSNRKGGKGKMDIWKAEKIGTTPEGFPVYGKVTNVENINTPGNEMSPFIHADGKTLYFASDHWPGMGGNDLFYARIDNNEVSAPQNMGYPINTSGNEEGMIVETGGEKAWFNSNNKGFGGRDIFNFTLHSEARPQPVSYVKAKVVDNKSGKILYPGVRLYDLNKNVEIQHIYPFENEGEFLLCLPAGKNYGLTVEKEGYLFCSRNFNLEQVYSKNEPLNLNIGLDPIEKGMITVLNNIFFDTDSFTLNPQSRPQLNEIVAFINNNPGLIIEIGGHTDNQGSEAYNNELSQKRARAVVGYLVSNGIAERKLKSRGYGFSLPVASNSTEEGRAANRRTELKLLEKP